LPAFKPPNAPNGASGGTFRRINSGGRLVSFGIPVEREFGESVAAVLSEPGHRRAAARSLSENPGPGVKTATRARGEKSENRRGSDMKASFPLVESEYFVSRRKNAEALDGLPYDGRERITTGPPRFSKTVQVSNP